MAFRTTKVVLLLHFRESQLDGSIVLHTDVVSSLSRSPVCSEIASCRGDHVRLAVRVKVYCYPEDITAVWIMFAVMYRRIL